MTNSELKMDILKLIVETEDPEILEAVSSYFHTLLGKKDWWQEISEKEKTLIQTGLSQIENGEGIPYEEVRAKARRLLQKPL
jgi:hypothetical protein